MTARLGVASQKSQGQAWVWSSDWKKRVYTQDEEGPLYKLVCHRHGKARSRAARAPGAMHSEAVDPSSTCACGGQQDAQAIVYVNGKLHRLPEGRAEVTLLAYLRGAPWPAGERGGTRKRVNVTAYVYPWTVCIKHII